jgi:hypothetical protein
LEKGQNECCTLVGYASMLLSQENAGDLTFLLLLHMPLPFFCNGVFQQHSL